jgi:hypothetical protein
MFQQNQHRSVMRSVHLAASLSEMKMGEGRRRRLKRRGEIRRV